MEMTTDWGDLDKRHRDAMRAVSEAPGIDLHGKQYKPVSVRVEAFRAAFGCRGRLRIVESSETPFDYTDKQGTVVTYKRLHMRAVVELLTPDGWQEFAQGQAEEVRGTTSVNIKSALENCETSAYGRALANFGLLGGEYASAEEMQFESLVSAKVAEIRGALNLEDHVGEERVAAIVADIEASMAGNNELQLAVHDRLMLKKDHGEINERETYKKYVQIGMKRKTKMLPNGRAA